MRTAGPQTALVTGGSRGIGRAIAERLGAAGMVVGVHYGHDEASARQAVAAVNAAGGRAFAVHAELASKDGIDAIAAGLEEGLRSLACPVALDILVNNAGIGCRADITSITSEVIDNVFVINVKAPLFVTQRLLPVMRDGGRIINISSVAHRVAHPHLLGYAMSKGAIEAFSRSLAAQVAPRGITVNSVAPGLIETGVHGDWLRRHPEEVAAAVAMVPFGRLGKPGDVADIVSFLASDQARWMTGERLEATGGAYL